MKEIPLECLSIYLPYQLKLGLRRSKDSFICTGLSLHKDGIMAHHEKGTSNTSVSDWYTPILRPLIDLVIDLKHIPTEPKFCALDWVSTSKHNGSKIMMRVMRGLPLDNLEYWQMQRLASIHFDVFRLIEKGLAIDANEFYKKPVKSPIASHS